MSEVTITFRGQDIDDTFDWIFAMLEKLRIDCDANEKLYHELDERLAKLEQEREKTQDPQWIFRRMAELAEQSKDWPEFLTKPPLRVQDMPDYHSAQARCMREEAQANRTTAPAPESKVSEEAIKRTRIFDLFRAVKEDDAPLNGLELGVALDAYRDAVLETAAGKLESLCHDRHSVQLVRSLRTNGGGR